MENKELEKLRYPIGYFQIPATITDAQIDLWINELEEYPNKLRDLVINLNEAQLDTPYRPNGWTVRQVIHHVSDSHHNSYLRFKWALTENKPLIKAYNEQAWADLFDTKTAPIELSLQHLKAVHAKLVYLLRGLDKSLLAREFIHPEGNVVTNLKENVGRYVHHGNHHFFHIKNLMVRNNW